MEIPSSSAEMEEIRSRIRAALSVSPHKSQKELAKLLGISPAQVTSLLKPGGRRLQAAEVPVVERYLGISILKPSSSPEGLSEYQASGLVAFRALPSAALARAPLPPDSKAETEGSPIALVDLPRDIRRYLESIVLGRNAEIWQLKTDLVQSAGYLRGDYVVVDPGKQPCAQDVVLAEVRESTGTAIPIFRAYVPPYLLAVTAGHQLMHPPILVDNARVAIIGPIVASVRVRNT